MLLPDAAAVDGATRVPESHLRALDAAALTGLAATAPALETRVDVTSALSGGCLATAFVWLQHQGALSGVAGAAGPAARFAPQLASGRVRAGVAITALRGPHPMRLREARGGWRLAGTARWVTGWGIVSVLRIAAIAADGSVTTVLADVGDGMRAEPARLIAANASATVTLTLDDVFVPADRLLGTVSAEQWATADASGLAGNGALALGVAARAAALAGSEALLADVARVRADLLAADVPHVPAARAACSALAVHAATVLAAYEGGRGVIHGSQAGRLFREAQFLLAFGSRPAIRAELLARLGA